MYVILRGLRYRPLSSQYKRLMATTTMLLSMGVEPDSFRENVEPDSLREDVEF
jgi:hypothetical protein